jgi:hypothetical protein
VLKRFPDMQDYADGWDTWWSKNRRLLIEAHADIAAPINTVTQQLTESIKVVSGDFEAAINVERTARIDADGAMASLITTVEANYMTADAAISASVVTEATARVTADAALATSITTVTTNYVTADATIAASVVTEANARSTADAALASSISTVIANYQAADTTLQTNINTAVASVTTEATARAAADSAEATLRTAADSTLTTSIGTVNSAVIAEASTRSSADGALSSSISSVIAAYTAADATISASVTTEATARAAADGTIHAQWGVSIDVNGSVVGRIHLDGTGGTSEFSVEATKFTVWNGTAKVPPFQVVGGVVRVNALAIASSDVSGLAATATSSDYTSVTGTKPPSNADVTLSAINGGLVITGGGLILNGTPVIMSSNYVAGTSGWIIDGDGDVEFSSGVFRGTLKAASIDFATIFIRETTGSEGGQFRMDVPTGYSGYWNVDVSSAAILRFFTDSGFVGTPTAEFQSHLKVTGNMQFGTYTAGALAIGGRITVIDAGGTARQLLCA